MEYPIECIYCPTLCEGEECTRQCEFNSTGQDVCEKCGNKAFLTYYPDTDEYLCQTCTDSIYAMEENMPENVHDGIIFGGH